ncbi:MULTISPECIES: hypothetical protein [unclassified Thiomonas]|jgi:hypothetical protein|uniref:hypothetical protein n=1 Tax=unclassified Thiomonas TaxID=2625466 RepID=UPI000BDCEBB6|nr:MULTISPECIES: hypothetical protein [unclassified Thiomonas]OZB72189.1 MAG: hypothetical protein B7X30_00965 [Thiomonas sp. 13-64-67]
MNHEEFLKRRTDALMREIGGMSLARVAAEGDPDAAREAVRLLDAWLTRALTRAECVQAREAAQGLGVDLLMFDAAQAEKEKNHE